MKQIIDKQIEIEYLLTPEFEQLEARYNSIITFRLNAGDVKRHTLQRLDSFVDAVTGKRITYAELTA